MLRCHRSRAQQLCCVLVLGATLNGCSLNSAVGPENLTNQNVTRGTSISPDLKGPLIYWATYSTNTIAIFSAVGTNPPEEGKITKGLSHPERLFVDGSGSVYATNNGKNTITAYKRGATSPFLTISNGVNGPIGLTVDAAGTVYCANIGNSSVTEYPKGTTSPSLTISMGGLMPEDLAIDSGDNLYVSYMGGSHGAGVMEFPPGSSTGKDLGISDGGNALEVDRLGNIIAVGNREIDIFPPGQTLPSKKISVTAGTPFELSLNKAETQLYVTVELGDATFIVQVLDYPNGTTLKNKITANDGQWQIAVSPDAVL
jgi:hypothetical protein